MGRVMGASEGQPRRNLAIPLYRLRYAAAESERKKSHFRDPGLFLFAKKIKK